MTRARRGSVSSESGVSVAAEGWAPPVFPKSAAELCRICEVMEGEKMRVLFNHLEQQEAETVANAFANVTVPVGTTLIKQGDEGDFFYIVDSGRFRIEVKEDGVTEVVQVAGVADSFGELALMYNSPRAATCTALEDSVVWALDRETFRTMCITLEFSKRTKIEMFLRKMEVLKGLPHSLFPVLADSACRRIYGDSDLIVKQGDQGDAFYVVDEGNCVCKVERHGKETEVCQYCAGDYFGELSLLNAKPRQASIYAEGMAGCIAFSAQTFERYFSPITEKLQERAKRYPDLSSFGI